MKRLTHFSELLMLKRAAQLSVLLLTFTVNGEGKESWWCILTTMITHFFHRFEIGSFSS